MKGDDHLVVAAPLFLLCHWGKSWLAEKIMARVGGVGQEGAGTS